MKSLRPVLAVVVLAIVGWFIWSLWPRGHADTLSGYVEGDLLYLSAPVSGAVARLPVEKGQRVEAGALLFQIDPRTAEADTEYAPKPGEHCDNCPWADRCEAAPARARS